MSRRTTRPRGKRPSNDHPSLWFFLALGLGILLLIWVFAHVVSRPVTPARKYSVISTQ